MRVLQLIDSLNIGGAEQTAVNYANLLAKKIDKSFLCATRVEGPLKNRLNGDVGYLFLDKRKTIDFKSLKRLSSFIKNEEIEVVHAHSTSFFFATLIKIFNRKLKLIWHDHSGNRRKTNTYKNWILILCSSLFYKVVVVNNELKSWAKKKLLVNEVVYLLNFSVLEDFGTQTRLKGTEGNRVVCLSNLRKPKNHIFLLKSFLKVAKSRKGWSLHLIGEDFNDDYSETLKQFVKSNKELEENVFFYGARRDVKAILWQSDIGVLSSTSEGLPLSLLEYGLTKLPVVATSVGDCDKVITNTAQGRLVKPNDVNAFSQALTEFIDNKELRMQTGNELFKNVTAGFSAEARIEQLVLIYK